MRDAFKILTLLTVAASLLQISEVSATHSQGSDISYTCLGGNQYLLSLSFYRDCSGINAPNTVTVNAASTSCGENLNVTLNRVAGTGQEITTICPTMATTCTTGNFPGVQEYVYEGIVNLPQQCADWVFSFSICCRNGVINTIQNPLNQRIYVEANLDNLNYPCNSSPSFSNPPVPFICQGQTYCFNHGAIDADGDSLVYSLITPYHNATTNVTYLPGYSATQPLTSVIPTTIDAQTGDVCMTPTQLEVTVFAVLVEEFRNGVKIGDVIRDMQVQVIACTNNNPYLTGIDGTGQFTTTACIGSTVDFDIPSADLDVGQNLTLSWNNGIPAGTFTPGTGSRPTGHFNWTPTLADVSSIPYCFTVTVEDDNCPFMGSQTYSFCITVGGAQVDAGVDQTTCASLPDVTLNGSVTPANGYHWVNGTGTYNPGDTVLNPTYTPSAAELAAGSATLVLSATGSGVCPVVTDTVIITYTDFSATVTSSSMPVSCNGGNDGQASVNVIGGTPPFTYTWNTVPAQNTPTATGLTSGTYTVTIADAIGCSTPETVTVSEPGVLQATATATDVLCNGGNDGTATLNVNGGTAPFTYSWTTVPVQNSQTATVLLAGNYIGTVVDANGCSAIDNVNVSEPTPISISATMIDSVDCFGGADGSVTVSATGGVGGYTYIWNTVPVQTGPTASALTAGTYQVTVTDANSCVASASYAIGEPDVLTLSSTSILNPFCFGDVNGAATVIASGGTLPYAYVWNTNPVQNGPTATGLASGNFLVTAIDAKGCGAVMPITITDPPLLNIAIVMVDSVDCNGASTGSAQVSATGGVGGYQFAWNTTPVQNGDVATGLSAGTYTATVTDANGCVAITQVTISEPAALVAIATHTNVTCNGFTDGTAAALVTGGTSPFTYSWNSIPVQNTATATGLAAGNYVVTIIDANGCSTNAQVAITEPAPLTIILVSADSVSCNGLADGGVVVAGQGGTPSYQYSWNTNPVQNTAAANGLTAGNYVVTVTDQNQCVANANYIIGEPNVLSAVESANTPVTCSGGSDGSSTVMVNGGTPGFSYVWNTSPVQATATASGLAAGLYSVAITDANGCNAQLVVSITEPDAVLTMVLRPDTICPGELANLMASASGGVGGYSFAWTQGLGSGLNKTVSPASTAMYGVTATDGNGCVGNTANVTITVNDISNVVLAMGPGREVCEGETTSISALVKNGIGNYEMMWSPINKVGPGPFMIMPEQSGTYTVIVEDGCDNQIQGEIEVVVNPLPEVSLHPVDGSGCGEVTLSFENAAINPAGTLISWDFGNGDVSSANPATYSFTESGTHAVTFNAMSAEGCAVSGATYAEVEINPIANAEFHLENYEISVEDSKVGIYNESTTATNFHWDFGDGTTSSAEHPWVHHYNIEGTYAILLVANNEYNCPDTAVQVVKVKAPQSFYAPNVFTPNGDGVNDYFLTPHVAIGEFVMYIYDRWGTMVFQTDDIDEGWDGTFRGNYVQQDVYIWKVVLKDYGGEDQSFEGHVTVLK